MIHCLPAVLSRAKAVAGAAECEARNRERGKTHVRVRSTKGSVARPCESLLYYGLACGLGVTKDNFVADICLRWPGINNNKKTILTSLQPAA